MFRYGATAEKYYSGHDDWQQPQFPAEPVCFMHKFKMPFTPEISYGVFTPA
jgi:hypothetical protein